MAKSPAVVIQPQGSITRGHAEQAVKTTACGTPDDSGDSDISGAPPLPTTASASGPRVHRAPGVPHALSFEGGNAHHSGASRRENANVYLDKMGDEQVLTPGCLKILV